MKYLSITFVCAIFISILGFSQSEEIASLPQQFENYLIIDPIIKAILESLRPKVANLKIKDVNETLRNPNVNGAILVNDILIQNADQFTIKVLKSSIVPLKLVNLTLTWNNITAKANYDIDLNILIPQLKTPIRLFAKGKANAILKNLFFTIGANIEMKNNAIQIKPKGLFGFDVNVKTANVTLTGLMGNADLGNSVGVFLSKIIPDLVDILEKPVFDTFQDDIIRVINEVLKKNGTANVMDEPQDAVPNSADLSADLSNDLSADLSNDHSADLSTDLSAEIASFFNEPLDLDFEDDESNFDF